MHLESEAEYAWRLMVDYGDRYPLEPGENDEFVARRFWWGTLWRNLGETTGVWWPFLIWAKRARLIA
jgi:hypothetical protein